MSETLPPFTIERARAVLQSQPFSVLLGAEILQYGPELCELRLPIRAQVQQQNGFVHGGVLSYAADNALTFAGGAALRVPVLTSEFKINYLRPATGEALVARARAVHAGRSQAVCQCEVFALIDGQERLCAVAQGTIAVAGAPR